MTQEHPERDLDKEFEELIARWDATGPVEEPLRRSDSPPAARRRPQDPTETTDATGVRPADPTADPDPPNVSRPPTQTPPVPPPGVNVWRGPTTWFPPEKAVSGAAAESEPDDEDEDEFRPDPVVLPPQEDLHFWGIVAGLVGGGLLLLYVALTGASTSSWWFLTAVGLFVGGFALLILRQPRERDTTDDGTRL